MNMKLLSNLTDSYSFTNQNVNEGEWIKRMQKYFVDHQEEIEKPHVSIYSVPKVLLATHPESYIPQHVALGPFHHWRPDVYDMQRYKLSRAQQTQKLMNVSFEHIVEEMKKRDEAKIRACYHNYLNMSGDTLMWMMVVDTAFLLDFLQVHYMKEGGQSMLVDVSRRKLTHIVILHDLVMLENQIPLFLIKTMLEHQRINDDDDDDQAKSAEETLKMMLTTVYHELSPFQEKRLPDVDINSCDHLLDYMHHMTVPANIQGLEIKETKTIEVQYDDTSATYDQESSFSKSTDVENAMNILENTLSKSRSSQVSIFGKLIKLLRNPKLKVLKNPAKNIIKSVQGDSKVLPLVEELTIPSVTKMAHAGFIFSPVNGGILDIKFSKETCTLYLPIIDLDVNTEVYLRNLVAYEACVASGPLVVARYTELMNGIIDTKEDAKYLRKKGIIMNHLKSDKEVADMWNGMSKSVKLTKVHIMDTVINDVNTMYQKTWRVRLAKSLKKHVYRAWKCLTFLAALLMIILTLVQTFCSVYTCTRMFHQLSDLQVSQGNN